MRSSFFSKCKQKIKRISTLGTIQVLMILTFFDPPTLSSDVIISYTHLNVTSSFPHTHPPSKIRQGLFLLKKSDILERINRFQVSFATDDGHPPCHQTSSFGHPTHPPLWWRITWMVPYQTNKDQCQKKPAYTNQKLTIKSSTILFCLVGQKSL